VGLVGIVDVFLLLPKNVTENFDNFSHRQKKRHNLNNPHEYNIEGKK